LGIAVEINGEKHEVDPEGEYSPTLHGEHVALVD